LEDTSIDAAQGGCRTFVVATRTLGGRQAVLLRTYGTASHDPFRAKIWEAARATSAAPTFFSPMKIDSVPYGDGGTGWNNPAREALNEANVIWPNRPIGCLISLGTGEEDPVQLVESTMLLQQSWNQGWIPGFASQVAPKLAFKLKVAQYCADCLTSCKSVHDDILLHLDRDHLRGRYFRFNTPGMGNIGLEEWGKIPDMISLTMNYMDSSGMPELKKTVAENLLFLHASLETSTVDRVGSVITSEGQKFPLIGPETSPPRSLQDIECGRGNQNSGLSESSAGESEYTSYGNLD
jgi:hypothetical protein